MSTLEVHQFLCRSDNYGVLIHDPASGQTASIDAPETGPVQRALAETGWSLTHILTTHHHGDHVEGHETLKRETGCHIVGPKGERHKIPAIDQAVGEGDALQFAGLDVEVLETPGHTLGHIGYVIPEAGLAFVGDTLFAMGCGRIFEGTAEMMWASLQKLAALPGDTIVYCGHEYTLANARFALTVDPDNPALVERTRQVVALRRDDQPTLPTTIDLELETNPFLRADDPAVRAHLAMESEPVVRVFAEIRARKDNA